MYIILLRFVNQFNPEDTAKYTQLLQINAGGSFTPQQCEMLKIKKKQKKNTNIPQKVSITLTLTVAVSSHPKMA
jgi:hypothetical protein